MKKLSLQREGYDLSVVTDPVFFLDAEKRRYRPLDEGTLRDLRQMRVKL